MTNTAAAEANRLYWETEKPVAEIAASLDLSRRALYDAIEPISAEDTCPACGGAMHYANRSARDAKQGTCYACATASPQALPTEPEAWTWSPDINTKPLPSSQQDLGARARRLGGAALLGAVLGAAATHLLLGRD
ncbi:MAG: hypothetical protein ABIV28_02670 [Longimicrobiales bacterium]